MTSGEKRLLTAMGILLVHIAQHSSPSEIRQSIKGVQELCKLMNSPPKPVSRWRTLAEWITN